MYTSHVVASGFLLALLALGLEALPAPQNLQKGPSGRAAALGRELAELLASASGPAAGSARGGTKQGSGGGSSSQQQQRAKGASSSSSSSSRLMRDLRTDTKQARAGWARGMSPEHHAGGGGGGGGGSRRFKGLPKKGLSKGCFGLKLDRIGSMSGLGC